MWGVKNADQVLPQHEDFIDAILRVLLSPQCWAVVVSERHAVVWTLLKLQEKDNGLGRGSCRIQPLPPSASKLPRTNFSKSFTGGFPRSEYQLAAHPRLNNGVFRYGGSGTR